MTGTAHVVKGDALNLPLPDESVDLIVTSPPYFSLRSYTDQGEHYDGQVGSEDSWRGYLDAMLAATREMVRVLKPSRSIFLDMGDKYAGGVPGGNDGALDNAGGYMTSRKKNYRASTTGMGIPQKSLMLLPERYRVACVDQLGLIVRSVIVWSKPNGLPESVTDRVRRSHEDWVHLTRQPRYYAAVDEIRQPAQERKWSSWSDRKANGEPSRQGEQRYTHGEGMAPNVLGVLPPSVWEIPTEPLNVPDHLGVDHFAAFPSEWPRRLIAGFCPESGTVLDPFGGTGTTAMVAKATGRVGISLDLSTDYCRLAEWRTTDPEQLGKVRGRFWADRQQTLDLGGAA